MPEFVEDDAGFVVPFSDIQLMAEKIELLYSNPRLKADLGERANQKVRETYNLDKGCEKLMKVISRFVSNRSGAPMIRESSSGLSEVDRESQVRLSGPFWRYFLCH